MSTHFDWTTGPLAEGLHCYRTQQFFEAHEHWEAVWLTLVEPEKSFLQSLVQISAAFHHLRRGNRIGAISLLTRALRRLDHCSSSFCCVNVALVREQAQAWLTALEGHHAELPGTFPEFEILNTGQPTEQ
jgi:predicted metal-dependent hydrolase